MNTALVPGSLSALANAQGVSLAEMFLNADKIALVDVSGSMLSHDSRGGRTRLDVAQEELAKLQNNAPGQWAVIAFSSEVNYRPAGTLPDNHGSTDLAKALQFARVADVPGMRFVIISDGEPDEEAKALQEAALFQSRIDVVYVGPEGEPAGRAFLERLAHASGGKVVTAASATELAAMTERLMLRR